MFASSQEVHALLDRPEDDAETSWTGPSDEDPTYQLLVDCNQLAVDIDNEIVLIHTFMKDKYRRKFPELESFVHDAVTYARVVQAIGNEMDLTLVDLEKTIPQVCSGLIFLLCVLGLAAGDMNDW